MSVRFSPAFLKFVLIGGFASLVNLLMRIVINRVTGYEVAIVGAFCIALLVAFELNRSFVFKSATGRWWPRLGRFLIVNLFALVQVLAISVGLARFAFPALGITFYPDTLAHAIALVSPLFTSFWSHRAFTFATPATAPS